MNDNLYAVTGFTGGGVFYSLPSGRPKPTLPEILSQRQQLWRTVVGHEVPDRARLHRPRRASGF
jgi:hypothetical protein